MKSVYAYPSSLPAITAPTPHLTPPEIASSSLLSASNTVSSVTPTIVITSLPSISPVKPVVPTQKPKITPANTNTDHVAPTAPHSFIATFDESTVQLSWFASSDNVGIKGYRIYRDGKEIGTTIETFYADVLVPDPSSHSYTVYAYDNAGNVSRGPSAKPILDILASNLLPLPPKIGRAHV